VKPDNQLAPKRKGQRLDWGAYAMARIKRAQGDVDTPIRLEVVPRRGLRREDAARYVGVSTAKFDECVKDGRMPNPFRIDGCVI